MFLFSYILFLSCFMYCFLFFYLSPCHNTLFNLPQLFLSYLYFVNILCFLLPLYLFLKLFFRQYPWYFYNFFVFIFFSHYFISYCLHYFLTFHLLFFNSLHLSVKHQYLLSSSPSFFSLASILLFFSSSLAFNDSTSLLLLSPLLSFRFLFNHLLAYRLPSHRTTLFLYSPRLFYSLTSYHISYVFISSFFFLSYPLALASWLIISYPSLPPLNLFYFK